MICKKHKGSSIPCLICMKDEYLLYKDDPKHDFSDVVRVLKENHML